MPMTRNRWKGFLPVVLFFIFLNAFFIIGKSILEQWNADQEVLIYGNMVLFAVTVISFFVLRKGMDHSNPNVFVRSVFGSFMIKFFICIIAALIYISIYKKDLNKASLFICMGLFLVYLFLEVSVFLKLLKKANNG
jgi:hypothetical protein